LIVAAAALVGGCSGSGFEYVKSAELGGGPASLLKVPDDWTVYTDERSFRWIRAFDSSDEPSTRHLRAGPWDAPVAISSVTITPEEAPVPVPLVRNAIYPIDDPTRAHGVIVYRDREVDLGARRTRLDLVFRVLSDEAFGAPYVVAHSSVIDAQRGMIYDLMFSCNVECFETNEAIIDEVMDSWVVEGTE
jgi:hypothetical protein